MWDAALDVHPSRARRRLVRSGYRKRLLRVVLASCGLLAFTAPALGATVFTVAGRGGLVPLGGGGPAISAGIGRANGLPGAAAGRFVGIDGPPRCRLKDGAPLWVGLASGRLRRTDESRLSPGRPRTATAATADRRARQTSTQVPWPYSRMVDFSSPSA